MSVPQETRLEQALRGEASKVYWLLLRSNRPVDAYDVQRLLHFNEPISYVQRQLEELRSIGLAEKQSAGNCFIAANEVNSCVLRHYINFGRLLFPRYFFYALFATTFYLAFLLFFVERVSRENLFIGFFGGFVCVILWYEARRFWQLRPY